MSDDDSSVLSVGMLCFRQDDSSAEEILSLIPSMSRFPPDQIELAIGIVVEAKERATGGM